MFCPSKAKTKDPSTLLFDEDDFLSYEDILKDTRLSKEDKERYEKLKLDRDRKLIQDKLNNLKLKSKNK